MNMPAKNPVPWAVETGLLERAAETIERAVPKHADFCCCLLCSACRAINTALLCLYSVQDGMQADWYEVPPEEPVRTAPKGPAPKPNRNAGPYDPSERR
jgi:hypothetical protein